MCMYDAIVCKHMFHIYNSIDALSHRIVRGVLIYWMSVYEPLTNKIRWPNNNAEVAKTNSRYRTHNISILPGSCESGKG